MIELNELTQWGRKFEYHEFSDGQLHIHLEKSSTHYWDDNKKFPHEINDEHISVSLDSSDKFILLAMSVSIVRDYGIEPSVILKYFPGRMDRSIGRGYPYTLKVMAGLVNSLNLKNLTVLCPHSKTTLDLLTNSRRDAQAENHFYIKSIMDMVESLPDSSKVSLVFPDLGCSKRFSEWHEAVLTKFPEFDLVELNKHRDLRTGKILGMNIISGKVNPVCIIVDDLCDGGATFTSAAKLLRSNGAQIVNLSVFHGIFSKGRPEGIDGIATTNTFNNGAVFSGVNTICTEYWKVYNV